MIKVSYHGRLGNQMFQYALGRILAEELGFQLEAEPLPFSATHTSVEGKVYTEEGYYFDGHKLDFEYLLSEQPQKRIILNGHFQRSAYYLPFWDKVKSWYSFPIDKLKRKYRSLQKINEEDILIYIRLSDYLTVYRWALTAQFYHTVLQMASYRNVYIITEDDEDVYLKEFERYNPTFLMADGLTQMFCGLLFNKIVMSCSTFAWWGAMLSDANEIYFPIDADGIWCDSYKEEANLSLPSYRRDVDLRVDESRITYFYNCPTVATGRVSSGLTTLDQVIPEAVSFHKKSKAFCFLSDN